jgi:hypothetical protein
MELLVPKEYVQQSHTAVVNIIFVFIIFLLKADELIFI